MTSGGCFVTCHKVKFVVMLCYQESLDASVITMEHLKMAIKQIQPSEVHSYQKLSTKFQRAVRCCDIKDEFNDMPCDSRSTQFSIW